MPNNCNNCNTQNSEWNINLKFVFRIETNFNRRIERCRIVFTHVIGIFLLNRYYKLWEFFFFFENLRYVYIKILFPWQTHAILWRVHPQRPPSNQLSFHSGEITDNSNACRIRDRFSKKAQKFSWIDISCLAACVHGSCPVDLSKTHHFIYIYIHIYICVCVCVYCS